MIESGFPGFVGDSWTGIAAPAGTPPAIIGMLNVAINAALDSPEITASFEAKTSGPQYFGVFLRRRAQIALERGERRRKQDGTMGRTSRVIGAVLSITSAVSLYAPTARAQTYPDRQIRIIVPTPPGGPVDAVARALARALAPRLGQAVIVDNRAGAGNTIGSKEAALADPDGYTLLFSSASGLVIAPMLHPQAGYDPMRSYAPIALVTESSNILVVNPSVPAKSVQELVAYAKANPGKVNFSSGGIGVLPHLIGEMFKTRAGIEIVHVPYRGGGPSIADVLGGQVDMTFEGTSVLLPLIQAGKLRALAVTSANRIPQLPDVPTMIEVGYPGFSTTSWTGLLAPAKTPPEIVVSLNTKVNAALASPEFIGALSALSSQPMGGPPQALTDTIVADIDKWAPIVKSLHLQMD